MGQLTFNIVFYLIGVLLALIPFLLTDKKSKNISKPLWYKVMVPIIFFLLVVMGVIKTVNDYSSQKDTDNHFTKLNTGISDLKTTIIDKEKRYSDLIKNLKEKGVDVKNNKPVIKNFNNKIGEVTTLNQY